MEFHGGNIYEYNHQQLIDFSSNINPLGIPASFRELLNQELYRFTQYPDINYSDLRRNIAQYLDLEDTEAIVLGNGAVEMIYKAIASMGFSKVITLNPTFSEYGRAARSQGIPLIEINMIENHQYEIDFSNVVAKVEENSLLILCNPNNPTGRCISKKEMIWLLKELQQKKAYLLVDEAFIEFTDQYPDTSIISEIKEYNNIMIIRAATKFFGMPGIRLGYGITFNTIWRNAIYKQMEPWNINTAAVIAGAVIFQDHKYIQQSRNWIKVERAYMNQELKKLSYLKVYPTDANFILCRSLIQELSTTRIKSKLVEKGILIRVSEGFQNLTEYHFRIAIKLREENNKLLEALKVVQD